MQNMKWQTTPVKDRNRTTSPDRSPPTADSDEDSLPSLTIHRMSNNDARRLSLPYRMIPEERIAPREILTAPRKIYHRVTLDQPIFVPPASPTPTAPFANGVLDSESFQTPRRRSTQPFVTPQQTPEGTQPQEMSPKSFGSLARHRSERVEMRVLAKDQDIVKIPFHH